MKILHLLLVVPSVLVLAACASLAQERVLYLEADSYGCGAADGLGCGLALAPVLARLDASEGVRESGASWDGRFVRIELEPGVDGERAVEASAAAFEGRAWRVSGGRVRGVDTWYDASDTVALSRHEAEVIVGGWESDLDAELDLSAEDRRRLVALLHEEVRSAFERAHDAGGGVHRLYEEIPESRRRVEQRLGFLAPDERADVLAFLDRKLAE